MFLHILPKLIEAVLSNA